MAPLRRFVRPAIVIFIRNRPIEIETGGRACRYRIRRSDDALSSQLRKDDPRRQAHGIVYKTHFADWEKPAEPVSSRETDATHVRERNSEDYCRGAAFILSASSLLRSGKIRQSNLSDRFSIFDPITFLTIFTFGQKNISETLLLSLSLFSFCFWIVKDHFTYYLHRTRVFCKRKICIPAVSQIYLGRVEQCDADLSNAYLVSESQCYNTSHLSQIYSCLLLLMKAYSSMQMRVWSADVNENAKF